MLELLAGIGFYAGVLAISAIGDKLSSNEHVKNFAHDAKKNVDKEYAKGNISDEEYEKFESNYYKHFDN